MTASYLPTITRETDEAPIESQSGAEEKPASRPQPEPSGAGQSVDVSIVMPCLNEVKTLPECIKEGQSALAVLAAEGLTGEIVIADNGSSDGSIELSEDLGARVVRITRKGYGNALIGGLTAARGRFLVMADSDASYDLRQCVSMVRCLRDGYELCMGNRFMGKIYPGAMPFKNRYVGNPLLSGVLNLLFHSGLGDAHCGMRAFTRDAFEKMRLTSSGMEFASEMVIKATLLDQKRTELPVDLRPDGRDRPPHLHPWRDGWRHLRYILMLSPMGLYFVPAVVFGLIGVAILALLLINRSSLVVDVGPIWFGDHWLIIASAMIVASHQALVFGLATTIYGVKSGYRKAPGWLKKTGKVVRLETTLIVGLALIVGSVVIFGTVFSSWSSQGFGSLQRIREMVAATTLGLLGIQTIFGSYLIAIVSGNEAAVADSLGDLLQG